MDADLKHRGGGSVFSGLKFHKQLVLFLEISCWPLLNLSVILSVKLKGQGWKWFGLMALR